MAKELTKIELDKQDIAMLVAEKYNLDKNSLIITVSHYNGDQREPEYTNIIVTGKKNN